MRIHEVLFVECFDEYTIEIILCNYIFFKYVFGVEQKFAVGG